ncbi:MAG: tRNA (guanosine(46)-N7)-methyltransferase TrmB [Clostridia bacterium]|nr:tRNA (guanosine(46)-N7)-methyltransferase TrmB [Clostridia bacterium]
MRLKKVKNAKEIVENSGYFVDAPEEKIGKWNEIFGNNNPIHIEIGMGKGKFIINMARKYPNINFIGIEKYDSVLVKAVKQLDELETKLSNLKLLLYDADKIEEVFDKEIEQIYLNFSDPWPKSKHEKRRLTSQNFLKKYDNLFVGKKIIIQKTDNRTFFDFSLQSIEEYGYTIDEVTYDLYSLNDETNVPTEYEEKFNSRGVKINRLKAHID